MKKAIITIVLLVITVYAKVGIIVNNNLIKKSDVRLAVEQYANDLLAFGTNIWIDTITFDEDNTIYKIRQLRDSLRVHYLYDSLEGAVLVGQLPYVMYEGWYRRVGGDNWEGDCGPIDYYFMDIESELDSAWKDTKTEQNSPNTPFRAGYFDYYTGDGKLEIWISRVIAHNLYYYFDDTIKFKEDSLIVAYFDRVHKWIWGMTNVPRRALLIGDFCNVFDSSGIIDSLNINKNILMFPHDQPSIIQREIQKGYTWMCIYEHSSEVAYDCARDHLDKNGKFFSAHFKNGIQPNSRSLVQMILDGYLPKALFFHNIACSNLNYIVDNCIGVMLTMLGEGLICFGATTDYQVKNQNVFTKQLSEGKTFGQAFISHVEEEELFRKEISIHGIVSLLGVGTLRLYPNIPTNIPSIIIDSVKVSKLNKNKYHLFNDTIILMAYLRASDNSIIEPTKLKLTWYGLNDSVNGNNVLYVMDGQKASTSMKEYIYPQIMLHVDYPGYLSTSKVIKFPMIQFTKVTGTLDNISYFHTTNFTKQSDGWNIDIIGTSRDFNYNSNNEDSYLYYFKSSYDTNNCYIVKAKVKDIISNTTNSKAGLMIRKEADYNRSPFVALSVNKNDQLIFEYRKVADTPVTRKVLDNYPFNSTYLMLKRVREKVYSYVSNDNINYLRIDSTETEMPTSKEYVGIFYCANDTIEQPLMPTATLSNVEILHIDTVLPLQLPSFYAKDTLVIEDRSTVSTDVGVGKFLNVNIDCYISSLDKPVVVCGNAIIKDRSTLDGDIELNGKLTLVNNGNVTGTIKEYLNNSFEEMLKKTVSTGNISKVIYNIDTIEPGYYRNITVKSTGKLVLKKGTYNIRSFVLEPDATIYLQDDVLLNISTSVILDDRYLIISDGSRVKKLEIYTNANMVIIGEDKRTPIQFHYKDITAPYALVVLKSRASYIGYLRARKIVLEPDVKIY